MTENEVFASVLAAIRTAGCEKHDAATYTRAIVPIVNQAVKDAVDAVTLPVNPLAPTPPGPGFEPVQ